MEDNYYPPNIANDLKIIVENQSQDPDYLTNSPYDQEDVEFITGLLNPRRLTNEDRWVRMATDVELLLDDLSAFRNSIRSSSDTDEKLKYYRMRTQLLDKLTSIQERMNGLREIMIFKRSVMKILEEVLEPDQRTRVSELLDIQIAAPSGDDLNELSIDTEDGFLSD